MLDFLNVKEIANLGGQVIIVLLFLYYLAKKDTEVNKMISNHLVHSNKVIKDNSKAFNKVSVNLKELSLTIKENGKKIKIN